MDFDAVVQKRKSVRSFKNKKSNWKEAILAIDSALQGPYAGNSNNLKFLLIEDKDKILKIARLAQQIWINEAPLLIIVCSDDSNLENTYGERGRIYSRQQAGAAIGTLLLKLTELGIDSCWVGSYSDELIKESLDIPGNIQIEAIIPIGQEQKRPGQEKRRKREVGDSIYWENWQNPYRGQYFQEAPITKNPWD